MSRAATMPRFAAHQAWRSSVLANPAGADIEAYFARTLVEMI
jgi:hypothetical protein